MVLGILLVSGIMVLRIFLVLGILLHRDGIGDIGIGDTFYFCREVGDGKESRKWILAACAVH